MRSQPVSEAEVHTPRGEHLSIWVARFFFGGYSFLEALFGGKPKGDQTQLGFLSHLTHFPDGPFLKMVGFLWGFPLSVKRAS